MKPHILFLLLAGWLVVSVVGPPVNQKKPEDNEINDTPEIFSMEYARYLQEVVQALEEDDTFRAKLQNASEDDVKSGKIAHDLDLVSYNVRSKLDEIKRQEVDRIRKLAREQMELSQGFDRKHLKIPMHFDHRNEHTFEIEDLKKLIVQTTKDLEETDRKRKKEFKEYEMDKEHNRLEKLKAMDDEHRRQAQEEYEANMKKHKEHPRLHHPGSKQQLEEVWEKRDHLPQEEFNPKTFFRMHDLNGDNFWSQQEVNALFQNELDKMYDPNASEDDIRERYEEMERMREHVFNESDTDRDGQISFAEFMAQTKKQEFEQDQGWQGLDEQPFFTPEELASYERQMEMQRLQQMNQYGHRGGQPMGQPMHMPQGMHPGPVYQPHPPPHHAQMQQQQHLPQQQQQQGYHPNQGMPIHHAKNGPMGGMHDQYQQPQQQQFQQPQQQQFQQPQHHQQQQFQQQQFQQQQFQQQQPQFQQQHFQQGGVPQQTPQFQQPGGVAQQQPQAPVTQQQGGVGQQQQVPVAQQQQFQQPGGQQQIPQQPVNPQQAAQAQQPPQQVPAGQAETHNPVSSSTGGQPVTGNSVNNPNQANLHAK